MSGREEKLQSIRHDVSMESHIEINEENCSDCNELSCLYFCPAGCFIHENGSMRFQYEGCLECGTCRIMCPKGVKTWKYPQGGYGVTVRIG